MFKLRTILLPLAGMLLLIMLASVTSIDMSLQQLVFHADASQWWIDQNAFLPRLVFYNAPRIVLAVVALATIVLLAWPASSRPGLFRTRQLVFALGVLLMVPAATNLVKRYSGVPCPYQIEQFGGDRQHVPVAKALTVAHDTSAGHCWPSGHASTGFAFMGLAYLAGTRSRRNGILLAAIAAGVVTGTYQVLKGAHFPSHVIGTFLLALFITNSLALALGINGPRRQLADVPQPAPKPGNRSPQTVA